ncbi:transposase [Zhongshania sp.]|uniref:transposase n=1 Tax=Zhongshania sp. TaxID=1971902 RepID=UPI003568ED00
MAYHLVQRGNNREPCFVKPENYQFYLQLWEEVSKRYGADVHAFCLMTNHIHFLVTPHEQDDRRKVRYKGWEYTPSAAAKRRI